MHPLMQILSLVDFISLVVATEHTLEYTTEKQTSQNKLNITQTNKHNQQQKLTPSHPPPLKKEKAQPPPSLK
jgi:hypothetical protein